MSIQTQRDPKNEAEITDWNSAGGRHWVERQQSQDIVLDPILQARWSERSYGRASVLSISLALNNRHGAAERKRPSPSLCRQTVACFWSRSLFGFLEKNRRWSRRDRVPPVLETL